MASIPMVDEPLSESDAALPAPAAERSAGGLDGMILFLAGGLMVLGVVMVYSASVSLDAPAFNPREILTSPLKQSVFTVAGFLAMLFAAQVDYRVFRWHERMRGLAAGALWVVAAGCLIAMLIPGIGEEQLGAQRSITVIRSPVNIGFQPAELAKVVLVIWLAALLGRPKPGRRLELGEVALPSRRLDLTPLPDMPSLEDRRAAARKEEKAGRKRATAKPPKRVEENPNRSFFRGFLPALLSGGVLIGLTGIEDFGTAALMGVVLVALLVMARAHWLHLGLIGLLGAVAGAVLVWLKPYRVERLRTFFSDELDTSAAGYQVHQSLIAIGSGGWWGRGLGGSVQKYDYLPQDNNDFIFAIVCEELGISGGIGVIAMFLLLLICGFRAAANAPDRFGRLLAAGLTLLICLQAAFNIGVVTNSIPTKGISLPFVSAGGSGVLFLGIAAGVLASVARARPDQAVRSLA